MLYSKTMITVPGLSPSGRDLLRYFQARRRPMVGLLERLVRLESPTSDAAAVDRCTAALADSLQQAEVKLRRVPVRGKGVLLIAEKRAGRKASGLKPLLLLAHTDTVWPVGTLAARPPAIKGDRLYGPGALDMKAGLVQAVFALRALDSLGLNPRRSARLFVNSAEETGNPEAARLIRALSASSEAVLCLEPCLPGGALKTRRKGRLVVLLETRGKPAHAGSPGSGINAIEEMSRQLLGLRRLRRAGTTVNIGRVEGGSEANVVADRAAALLDVRFWEAGDRARLLKSLADLRPFLLGARVSFRILGEHPPLERTEASRRLFNTARRIASGLGVRLRAGKTGGGSDASLASRLGLPTLDGLGPDGAGIHAENEHVLVSSLIERTALLTLLLSEL
ncbi:MAG: M20 family metallopeptidase [Candidatus Aminicenantes bacterium]|nr:M20 family metallopeptidase [Candidatus Aminicenantes bacterium]